MKVRPSLVLAPVLFLMGMLALGAAFIAFRPQAPTAQSVGAALVGGPFKLVDQTGQEFTEKTVAGKPFLVFFGFTNCPDVCPTKLFEISQVLNALGDGAKDLEVLFVTVDPERDTPEVMGRYVSSFNPRIKGLTGDRPSVDAMIKAYRAYAKKVPLEGGSYTMDHTAVVYMMDRNGQFVAPLNLERPQDDILADLRRIV